jgi:ferredoxin
MKITVDINKCIGCNMCEDISDGAMGTKFGKDGKAGINPKADLTDHAVVSNLKLAAETCPMQAITIEE